MAAALLSLFSFCFLFAPVHSQICPGGWQYFGESCYTFGDIFVTWWDAQAICKSFNGKLAEIETAEENDFVKNIARNRQATYTFLGGTDIFDEGIWLWASTGKTIYSFIDWDFVEPDNLANQDCLVFYSALNYQWDDNRCDRLSNFICESMSTKDEIVG